MGPPAKREAAAPSGRAARERWVLPHAPSGAGGTSAGGGASAEPSPSPSSAEHVEWASPTSIRARSRPSNLHSYLRSNAAFPLAAAASASPRPLHRVTAAAAAAAAAAAGGGGGGGAAGSVSSGGSTGAASPRKSRAGRVRSQSTRATQTSAADVLLDNAGGGGAPLSLGVYGDVAFMGLETVDLLMDALQARRQALVDSAPHRPGEAAPLEPQPRVQAPPPRREQKDSEDEEDSVARARTSPAAGDPAPLTGRVRSRSYEALAKLEQILEARHQQLMHDGALDDDQAGALSLHGPPGADLAAEIRKLQQSFLLEARRQR